MTCDRVNCLEKFNPAQSPKTYEYVIKNITPNIRCNRCGSICLKSEAKGYKYQCMYCDEDLYSIETHESEKYNENEFNDVLITTRDLLLLDT